MSPPMPVSPEPATRRSGWRRACLLGLAATAVAVVSALPYAGGWNDGAWLAPVETLIDYGTLVIDQSIYVDPSRADPSAPTPYPSDHRQVMTRGTLDKLWIDGHYYSARPPVPALLLAAGYAALQRATGLTARQHPDRFAYAMTLLSTGVPYLVTVLCVDGMACRVLASARLALALTASLALATITLSYTRQVNSHLLLLSLAAALMLGLLRLADHGINRMSLALPAALGTVAGFAYTVDLGAGPLLLLTVTPVVAHRVRGTGRGRRLAGFLLASLPWIALHHVMNYCIAGTLLPASAVADYVRWPGSPFTETNLTGAFVHHDFRRFVVYSLSMLVGKRGFLLHNPVLLLAATGGLALTIRKDLAERPELLFAVAWSMGTWLLYALGSNNYAGASASIRWFLPLLAPGFFALALVLRDAPWRAPEFALLSAGGLALSLPLWHYGPWLRQDLPYFWPTVVLTLAAWAACWLWERRTDLLRSAPGSRA
jgi:hypothetical protein